MTKSDTDGSDDAYNWQHFSLSSIGMVSAYFYNVLTEPLKQNVMDIGLKIRLLICSFIQI